MPVLHLSLDRELLRKQGSKKYDKEVAYRWHANKYSLLLTAT